MKIIQILFDSLNRHYLSAYGNEEVRTPNLDSFTEESVIFDNHWLGSAPCMPARRDMMTGRLEFLERSWGPIEPFDKTLPELLQENDIFTHIVTDHYHYLEKGGENYLTSFDTWELFRGQEEDPWVSRVDKPQVPEYLGKYSENYYLNQKRFKSEKDFPTPKTFRSACRWLDENKGADDFLLWVEVFDPHQPFDAPKKYLDMYPDDWAGPKYFRPRGGKVHTSSEAIKHLRNQYAATLTMVDHWFGKFLNKIKNQGLMKDSLIILTSDHGILLGEHGFTGKNVMPVYSELAHLPAMVHLPESKRKNEKVSALTQNIDIYPTVLDYFGIEDIPDYIHGSSWKPLLEGEVESIRDEAIYGYFGKSVNLTDGDHIFMKTAKSKDNAPLNIYSSMPVGLRQYWPKDKFSKIECGRFLAHTNMPIYKLPINEEDQRGGDANMFLVDDERGAYNESDMIINLEDKKATQELDDQFKEKRANFIRVLKKQMQKHQAPTEQFKRLGIDGSDKD